MTTTTDQRRSVKELLVALAGLCIWFAHFGAVYALQGFGCNIADGSSPGGQAVISGAMLFASAIAVSALALIIVTTFRRAQREASDANTQDDWRFLHYLQFAIAALALMAVIWTTLTVLMLPTCAPVFSA